MATEDMCRLIERAAHGDQAAWNTIVDEYSMLLWSVVRRYRLREARAADAVQTTWLRLVENIGRIREPDRLAGWLRVTAERICLDAVRDGSRETPVDEYHEVGSLVDPAELPGTSLLREERAGMVRRAVDRLPDNQRALMLLLVASPPLSYEQIGARLGMPVGSIGPTRARILVRLRTYLATADLHDLALG